MVESATLLFHFNAQVMMGESIDILSLFNDKLLVSGSGLFRLYVYSRQGQYLSLITIENLESVYDAAWTPSGNIIYTTVKTNKVVVMLESGRVIARSQTMDPRRISVSADDIIFVADYIAGVFQSTDGGVTWKLLFKSAEGWQCWQAIKVTFDDQRDEFWTREFKDDSRHLRIYIVEKHVPKDNVRWRDVKISPINDFFIDLAFSSLSHDGKANLYLSDRNNKAVHVYSLDGQYRSQLLSSNSLTNSPRKMVVDKNHQLLYVGERGGLVEVFRLTYMKS